jgi:formylglycine-generating enzyme required for sulfatase activity
MTNRISLQRLSFFILVVIAHGALVIGAKRETQSAPRSDPPEGMTTVSEGSFLYGATQKQFNEFMLASRMRFPGIEETYRQMFVIPPQSVALDTFYIDEFEITNEQYAGFIEDTGYTPSNPADYLKHWRTATRYPDWAADFPVVWVSQGDAAAYCEWRGARLPTDEEWEKAARGSTGLNFPWGNETRRMETANVGTGKLEPSGNRPGDRSPYGVYDLGGNVAELTSTIMKLKGHPLVVLRGGSFQSRYTEALAYYRFIGIESGSRKANVGFRCAAD